MSFTENRRHPRFPFLTQPLVFSVALEEAAPPERSLRVEARDISLCGMKFFSNRKIPVFTAVQFSLFGKQDGREVATISGKVVRLEEIDTGHGEKTYGIALEFISGAEPLAKVFPARASGTNESGT